MKQDNKELTMSQQGLDLIKFFEGFSDTAYKCPSDVWTIGYGHTLTVHEGMIITREEGEDLLKDDLYIMEQTVKNVVKVPLSQAQFDALTSLTFNIGQGSFKRSTLLEKLNSGDYEGAAEEFPKWRRSGGEILKGLERRRAAEKLLFEGKDWKDWEQHVIYNQEF